MSHARLPLRGGHVRRVNLNGKMAFLGGRPPLNIAILHRGTHRPTCCLPYRRHSPHKFRGERGVHFDRRGRRKETICTPSNPFDVDRRRPLSPQTIGHEQCQPPKKELGTTLPNSVLASSNAATDDGCQSGCVQSGGRDLALEVAQQIIATAASPRVNIRTKIRLLSEITSVGIWDLSALKKGTGQTRTDGPINRDRPGTFTSDPARGDPPFFSANHMLRSGGHNRPHHARARTLSIITSSIIREGIGRRDWRVESVDWP